MNNINCLKDFFNTRELAWKAKEKQLNNINGNFGSYGTTKSFNKEFRTLHLDFGRQTGNTSFIIKKCQELAIEKKLNCFCFFLNSQMIDFFWREMERRAEKKLRSKVSTYNKIYTNISNIYTYSKFSIGKGFGDIPNSYAFVDVSYMWGEEQIDKIMEQDQWSIITLL